MAEKPYRHPPYSLQQKTEAMHLWASEGISLGQLASRLKIRLQTLFDWKKRRQPEDWEIYRNKIATRTQHKVLTRISTDLAEMQGRHLQAAQDLIGKATKVLATKPGRKMTWNDVRLSIVEGAKLERLTRGEATERTEDGLSKLAELVERWHQQGGR